MARYLLTPALLLALSSSLVDGFQLPRLFGAAASSAPSPTAREATTATATASPQELAGTTGTWNREGWIKGFETARTETSYEIQDIVEGSIPQDLTGTLFRNGHAKFDVEGLEIAHPFDGDGMISAVTFKDGRAFFRNRFVETEGYKKEKASKKIEYRGTFGTQKPGGWIRNIFDTRRKNVANTNVIFLGESSAGFVGRGAAAFDGSDDLADVWGEQAG